MKKVGQKDYPSKLGQLSEIQGIVASGYSKFPAMSCLLFHIEKPQEAVQSLRQIQSQISFSDNHSKDQNSRLNLAFTWEGLQTLNSKVTNDETELFKREFREGMVTPNRQRVLGDLDNSLSAPSNWLWGQPAKHKVHLAVLVYAHDTTQREARINELLAILQMQQMENGRIDSVDLKDGKEHFGFRDGISQPWLRGLTKQGPAADEVAWGEVLLGHRDNSATVERHPKIGINGSYLVIRQIEQDVQGFWQSFNHVDNDPILLASKQMGRWPDGTSITLNSIGEENKPSNDFDYRHDQEGLNCPLGSHVRRCNPRSGERRKEGGKDRHRILRRGRAYGVPAPAEVFPAGLRSHTSEAKKGHVGNVYDENFQNEIGLDKHGCRKHARGLIFMCLNASFERQFEFIQQNWINSSMAGVLSDEHDPIASQLDFDWFTVPTKPIRKRCPRTKPYIKTIGGEYFFLPSRSAISEILS